MLCLIPCRAAAAGAAAVFFLAATGALPHPLPFSCLLPACPCPQDARPRPRRPHDERAQGGGGGRAPHRGRVQQVSGGDAWQASWERASNPGAAQDGCVAWRARRPCLAANKPPCLHACVPCDSCTAPCTLMHPSRAAGMPRSARPPSLAAGWTVCCAARPGSCTVRWRLGSEDRGSWGVRFDVSYPRAVPPAGTPPRPAA